MERARTEQCGKLGTLYYFYVILCMLLLDAGGPLPLLVPRRAASLPLPVRSRLA